MKDRTTIETVIDREGEELFLTVDVRGEYEPADPDVGIMSDAWTATSFTATDDAGRRVVLTESEEEAMREQAEIALAEEHDAWVETMHER
jgi:hypothetical protein